MSCSEAAGGHHRGGALSALLGKQAVCGPWRVGLGHQHSWGGPVQRGDIGRERTTNQETLCIILTRKGKRNEDHEDP